MTSKIHHIFQRKGAVPLFHTMIQADRINRKYPVFLSQTTELFGRGIIYLLPLISILQLSQLMQIFLHIVIHTAKRHTVVYQFLCFHGKNPKGSAILHSLFQIAESASVFYFPFFRTDLPPAIFFSLRITFRGLLQLLRPDFRTSLEQDSVKKVRKPVIVIKIVQQYIILFSQINTRLPLPAERLYIQSQGSGFRIGRRIRENSPTVFGFCFFLFGFAYLRQKCRK